MTTTPHPVFRILVKLFIAILVCVVGFLGGLIILGCLPYRLFVLFLVRIIKKERVEVISGVSQIYSVGKVLTGTSSAVVSGLVVVDGDVPLSRFRFLFRDRILQAIHPITGHLMYKKLQQNYFGFLGYSFLTKAQGFNFLDHVRDWDFEDLTLPSPCTEDDLSKVVFQWLGQPWRGASPWECVLIHNFRSKSNPRAEKQMLIAFRIDHTLADGFSLYLLFERLFDHKDKVELPGIVPKSWWQRWCRRIIYPLVLLLDVTDYIYAFQAGAIGNWSKKRDFSLQYHTVLSDPIPVSVIKDIKNEYKVNYFVVATAALAQAFYRVHEEAGLKLPSHIRIDFPQPRPGHPGGLTNHMYGGMLVVKLKGHHTLEDLEGMNRRYQRIRQSLMRQSVLLLFLFTDNVPIYLYSFAFKLYRPTGMLLGNIPVNTERITFENYLVSGGWTAGRMLSKESPIGAATMTFGLNSQQRFHFGIEKTCFPSEKIFKKMGCYVEEAITKMHQECQA